MGGGEKQTEQNKKPTTMQKPENKKVLHPGDSNGRKLTVETDTWLLP